MKNAQHEEYDADASELFISRMACSLAGKTMNVTLKSGTLAHRLYRSELTKEQYYRNFGINPLFQRKLNHPLLSISGTDHDGKLRILEIPSNRFFVVTLFVPQTQSLPGAPIH